jgi:hypothetical protein
MSAAEEMNRMIFFEDVMIKITSLKIMQALI